MAINEATQDIHSWSQTPILCSLTSSENRIYIILDLKDAFFSIPLDEGSKEPFAFEWEDPHLYQKQQYWDTWVV